MKDEHPPRAVSSTAWTGLPPETPCSGRNLHWQPPIDPARLHTVLMVVLLCGGVLLLQAVWLVTLIVRSPLAPSAASRQTEALVLYKPRRGPPTHVAYVTPAEALINRALALSVFAVPGGYLAWGALRRRVER